MYNILICDDDKDIVNALKIYLSDPQYRLFEAFDGARALEIASSTELHLVLMDIMMPVMDGLSALAAIRKLGNVPVILLTAKGEDADKVMGLNLGADDYITKPFSPLEVTARVNSQIRRYTRLGALETGKDVFVCGGLELDDRSKTASSDGEPVSLTPKEFDILRMLMSSPGTVYSPKEIYRQVWQEEPLNGSENTVAVHIRHLREKVEIDPNDPRYIKVIFGRGYKIEKGNRQ